MSEIEILAPAGSEESVIPAVRLGANAVYLGAHKFNARAHAKNFDCDALIKIVEYCHVRDVKVYMVMNTLIKDNELNDVLKLIEYACSLPVDALIIQDLGLVELIKSVAPGMKIHGSTQMSVHTPAGAKFLYERGFSRVVLSRELSRDEIKEISESCPIELEVFVHGALCMSVSGQCYLSSIIGGRSGNRGLCAQPCRLPFSVCGGTGHDLSLKDLSLIDYVTDMKNIGITSIKIEGRMKRPEYVAAATRACRLAVEGKKCDPILKQQLESVFSRSGFTDGYYTSKRGKHMFGIRSKENVIAADTSVLSGIRKTYHDEVQNIPIKFNIKIKSGEKIVLAVKDLAGNQCSVEGPIPQQAEKHSITKEMCIQQLKKTGGTPFLCDNVFCEIDDGLAVPVSLINAVRRDAIKKLEDKRKQRPKPEFHFPTPCKTVSHISKKISVRARFPHTNVPDVFKSCELVYVPLFSAESNLENLLNRGFNVAVEIPRGMFGREKKIISMLNSVKSLGIDDVWASNVGAIKLANDLNFRVHGGFGLNVTNSLAIQNLEKWGLCDVETSFELTYNETNNLLGNLKRGVVAYGRLPLMLMRNCPIMNHTSKCEKCKNAKTIQDRKKINFPIMCESGCIELLNSVPLYLGDQINKFKSIDFVVLRFTVENSVESGENFLSFNSKKTYNGGFTRGLYARGVD